MPALERAQIRWLQDFVAQVIPPIEHPLPKAAKRRERPRLDAIEGDRQRQRRSVNGQVKALSCLPAMRSAIRRPAWAENETPLPP